MLAAVSLGVGIEVVNGGGEPEQGEALVVSFRNPKVCTRTDASVSVGTASDLALASYRELRPDIESVVP